MVASKFRSAASLRPVDFLTILRTPWITENVTIAWFCAAIFLPTAATEYGRLTHPDLLNAALIGLISITSNGTLLLLARPWIARLAERSVIAVLGILGAIGASRGVITSLAVSLTDLEARTYMATRVALGAFSAPIMLAFVAIVVSRITVSRRQRRETRDKISEAAGARNQVLHDIEIANERFLDDVDQTLRPAVNTIVERLRSGFGRRDEVAHALDSLAEEVVRPLSHSLADNSSRSALPRGSATREVDVPGMPALSEYLNPYFAALAVGLGGFSVMLDGLQSSGATLAAIIAAASTFLLIAAAQVLLYRKVASTLVSALVIMGIHSVVWIPAQLINDALIFPDDLIVNYAYLGIATTPLLGLLYILIVRGSYSGRQQLAILDAARVDMVLQQSEARRSAWLRQRHVAHTLHSSIQSRIHAQARLLRSGTGELSDAERADTIVTLDSILAVATEEPPTAVDAIDSILQLSEFWSGMCEITLEVGEGVREALASDVAASEAVSVLTLEIVSNAIRHGHATAIDIDITRDTDETVRIRAINDGRLLDPSHRPGLGMAIYEELAAEWSVRSEDHVTVDAVVAARGNISA